MDRRRMLGLVGALALAIGVQAGAARSNAAGCACCGEACACPACVCDADARQKSQADACACCDDSVCCTAEAAKAAGVACAAEVTVDRGDCCRDATVGIAR
ncbi:MAG: hypothetical protein ACLQGP_25025 [Isosphaeraceae bacterium]